MMMNVISFSYLPPAAAHLNKGNTQISQQYSFQSILVTTVTMHWHWCPVYPELLRDGWESYEYCGQSQVVL